MDEIATKDIYIKLADFGKKLLEKRSIVDGLPLISKYAKDVIGAQRCSIFINDLQTNELWTTISDGVERIVIPLDKGLVGYTIKTREPVIANDPYINPHFFSKVDEETGFKTQNIATVPIFNAHRDIIGVLELLNKDGGFSEKDIKFMIFFTHYISGFLELVTLYENGKNPEESNE